MVFFDVQINYKSGVSVVVDNVKSFTVKAQGGGLEISWQTTSLTKSKPLYLNPDQVESVYQVGSRHRFICRWF